MGNDQARNEAMRVMRTRYKLNYIATPSKKMNTLNENTLFDDTVILVHPCVGFRYRYLNLFGHRMCRGGLSAHAEASAIILTNPTSAVEHVEKKRSSLSD